MQKPLKVYCEHGAITKQLRELQRDGKIRLVHFPVDPNGRSKHLDPSATPSNIRWEDGNMNWNEAKFDWNETRPSEKFDKIIVTVGHNNRRDALHVDSAFKTECVCLVSKDNDILGVRAELFELLQLRIFSPQEGALYEFLTRKIDDAAQTAPSP